MGVLVLALRITVCKFTAPRKAGATLVCHRSGDLYFWLAYIRGKSTQRSCRVHGAVELGIAGVDAEGDGGPLNSASCGRGESLEWQVRHFTRNIATEGAAS
jgi:hypothetical protein